MQPNESNDVLVMFVDVAGSTKLYETLGESEAFTQISSCLAHLGALVDRFNGSIIKHIGDEVMCIFPHLVKGIQAAIAAQVEMSTSTSLSGLPVRIGCHYGPVLYKNDDIYGDTVNVAAHLAALAHAKQILTSDTCLKYYEAQYDVRQPSTHSELFKVGQHVPNRFLTRFRPKGKEYQVTVHSLIWEGFLQEASTDITFIQSLEAHHNEHQTKQLLLKANGETYILDQDHNQLSIGRGQDADICLNDGNVSRIHGVFKVDAGQFLFTDRSSNGSYLSNTEGKPQFIHRQTVVLSDFGQLSCGQAFELNDAGSIEFEIITGPVIPSPFISKSTKRNHRGHTHQHL